jgi:hypothetical protein
MPDESLPWQPICARTGQANGPGPFFAHFQTEILARFHPVVGPDGHGVDESSIAVKQQPCFQPPQSNSSPAFNHRSQTAALLSTFSHLRSCPRRRACCSLTAALIVASGSTKTHGTSAARRARARSSADGPRAASMRGPYPARQARSAPPAGSPPSCDSADPPAGSPPSCDSADPNKH